MRLLFHALQFTCTVSAIWPIPTSYQHGSTVLSISRDVLFSWTHSYPNASLKDKNAQDAMYENTSPEMYLRPEDNESTHQKRQSSEETALIGDDLITYAINDAYRIIFEKNIVPWKFHPRSWTEPNLENVQEITTIQLQRLKNDPENIVRALAGTVDESYTLSITETGRTTIAANSSIGLVRGITTLTQLFYQHTSGAAYTPYAPLSLTDTPKFPHRGLNLDVSRHFYPIPDIKRTIRALSYNKMSRLHLHITDSQSWPLDIPSLPNLARKGAYTPSQIYTADDFDDLQHYAALHGVQLITEIDMPGHTSSIHHSYPDLIAAFDIQPDHYSYAAEPPSGTLKLNSSAVDAFLDALWDDLLPRVAPYAGYFHTGGDEVNANAYTLDETVRSGDRGVLKPLMQAFVERNHAAVRKRGVVPVVWEEMLLEWDLRLGEDVVVQSWRSDDAVKQIVERGYKALFGNYMSWYLDCGKGQWLNPDSNDPGQYQDYCAPYHNWRAIYSVNPLANIPASKHHLVLGGEVHLWGEQTDPSNADQMTWPRAAAAAEVLWSGPQDSEGLDRSQREAAPRLSEMRERLVALGISAEPIQMPYCTMEGGCGL